MQYYVLVFRLHSQDEAGITLLSFTSQSNLDGLVLFTKPTYVTWTRSMATLQAKFEILPHKVLQFQLSIQTTPITWDLLNILTIHDDDIGLCKYIVLYIILLFLTLFI